MSARGNLVATVAALHRQYGDPVLPASQDAFALILWEQVAYLVEDPRRAAAFDRLRREVGLTPAAVAKAPRRVLETIARDGGSIAAAERAGRMRRSAEMVVKEWGGNLQSVLALPYEKARRALQRFPMIGPPGADKILVLTGSHPVLALDSNGARVLLRLGYGEEGSSYATTYRQVQEAAAPPGAQPVEWFARTYGLLRQHGKVRCRRKSPECTACCLASVCPASTA